jgi:tetratricopeptide (TPR) repeat protein
MRIIRVLAAVAALSAVAVSSGVFGQGIGTAGYEINYGDDYLGARQYDLAAMRYHQATELDPKNAEAFFLLAKASFLAGKVSDANAALARAYALDPALKAREGELAIPAGQASAPAAATAWTGLTVPADARNAIGSAEREMNYGKGYLAAGDYELAAMRLRQAVAMNPDLAEAQFWLAGALRGEGKAAEAAAPLARALALDPLLKAHEGELAAFRPKPKPAAPAAPAMSKVPAKPVTGRAKCDDLYSTCYVTATRCGMNGCTTDYGRQGMCMTERNACYARNPR